MRANFKDTLLSSALLLAIVLLVVVVVQCASLGTEEWKLKKSSVQFAKKSSRKKIPLVASEYGSTHRWETGIYEVQPQLETIKTKDQDFHWPSRDDERKSEAAQAQNRVNRLKRNASNVYPAASGKEIGNNYKKAKFAEIFAPHNGDSSKNPSKSKSTKKYRSNAYDEENLKALRLKRAATVGSSVAQRLDANASDYYAQRKVVMERYYARQRQISQSLARYSITTTATTAANTPTSSSNRYFDLDLDHDHDARSSTAATATATATATAAATSRDQQGERLTVNLLSNLSNDGPNKSAAFSLNIGEPLISLTRLNDSSDNYRPDTDADNYLSTTRAILEKEASPRATPPQCDNVRRSGSYPSKRQNLSNNNCSSQQPRGNRDQSGSEESPKDSVTEIRQWGTCTGKIVYQHNLFLTIKGPSNLDSRFQVAIQAPICISCVEIVRYNDTRAYVTLEEGGRGYEFITLRLKAVENEGFSYIIKVWGDRKTGDNCPK